MFRSVKAICTFSQLCNRYLHSSQFNPAVILLEVAIVLYPISKITYLCAMNVDIKIPGIPGVFCFFVVKSAEI